MTYDAGRIRHDGSLMHYSRASNGSSIPSNWKLSATGDTGVVWTPEAGGSVSYGSNSNDVGNLSAAGASSLVSRTDHVHRGVHLVSSNGSNSLYGDVNLSAGSGIALGVAGQTITLTNTGSAGGGGSVSYGSNSNEVSYANAAGASSLVSRADHVHLGVTSISHSSNTYTGPVTLQTEGSAYIIRPSANVFTIGATGGGGGAPPTSGSSGYDLDNYSLDGTYGDDFTGSSLSGSWTRRNFTSGAETYQLGQAATYMRIAFTGRAAGDGYFRTAPSGDWTFMMSFVPRFMATWQWSLCVVDSAGSGVGVSFANGGPGDGSVALLGITTYTGYSGSFQIGTRDDGNILVPYSAHKNWLSLRKSGTNYYGASSKDGELFSPETPAFSSGITVDRVGMIVHPFEGITTTAVVDVDLFNKIA